MTHPADSYLSAIEARQLYQDGDSAHDFDHVLRVALLAEQIAVAEGADILVVRLAALFHDVPTADGERNAHHLAAAQFAGEWLRQRGLDDTRIANVVHAIESHRFRHRTVQPATLEAQCLYDADKLESIGAIGVARAFAYAGTHGSRLWTVSWRDVPPVEQRPSGVDYTPVHEFVYKLKEIPATLHTSTARRLGAGRYNNMITFFDQLDAEVRGLA
jgi:uncharacterized protein